MSALQEHHSVEYLFTSVTSPRTMTINCCCEVTICEVSDRHIVIAFDADRCQSCWTTLELHAIAAKYFYGVTVELGERAS